MIGVRGWSRTEDKVFEESLAVYWSSSSSSLDDDPDRWRTIAARLPGKTAAEVREHYATLVHDVTEIDSGRVEIPWYGDGDEEEEEDEEDETVSGQMMFGGRRQSSEQRKRGTPWTEEEHRLFLIGLEKYGKGDWRSISRKVVITRTPTQVASHAQKYFIRQSVKKERKRSSIHDITTVGDNAPVPIIEQSWNHSSSNGALSQLQTPSTAEHSWIHSSSTGEVRQLQTPSTVEHGWIHPSSTGEVHQLQTPSTVEHGWIHPSSTGEVCQLQMPSTVEHGWIHPSSTGEVRQRQTQSGFQQTNSFWYS